jgi:fatty acid desaturase
MRASNDTDVGLKGFLSYALTVGLNIHTPHHFFPTADHAILPAILDIIQQTCR